MYRCCPEVLASAFRPSTHSSHSAVSYGSISKVRPGGLAGAEEALGGGGGGAVLPNPFFSAPFLPFLQQQRTEPYIQSWDGGAVAHAQQENNTVQDVRKMLGCWEANMETGLHTPQAAIDSIHSLVVSPCCLH